MCEAWLVNEGVGQWSQLTREEVWNVCFYVLVSKSLIESHAQSFHCSIMCMLNWQMVCRPLLSLTSKTDYIPTILGLSIHILAIQNSCKHSIALDYIIKECCANFAGLRSRSAKCAKYAHLIRANPSLKSMLGVDNTAVVAVTDSCWATFSKNLK